MSAPVPARSTRRTVPSKSTAPTTVAPPANTSKPTTPANGTSKPAATAARKPSAAASKAQLEQMLKDALAAQAAAEERAQAAERARSSAGYARYATCEIPSAMQMFVRWIAREFPGLDVDLTNDRDARLVTIASKAYRYAQASDLNVARRAGE